MIRALFILFIFLSSTFVWAATQCTIKPSDVDKALKDIADGAAKPGRVLSQQAQSNLSELQYSGQTLDRLKSLASQARELGYHAKDPIEQVAYSERAAKIFEEAVGRVRADGELGKGQGFYKDAAEMASKASDYAAKAENLAKSREMSDMAVRDFSLAGEPERALQELKKLPEKNAVDTAKSTMQRVLDEYKRVFSDAKRTQIDKNLDGYLDYNPKAFNGTEARFGNSLLATAKKLEQFIQDNSKSLGSGDDIQAFKELKTDLDVEQRLFSRFMKNVN
jgi:hypothetical protein